MKQFCLSALLLSGLAIYDGDSYFKNNPKDSSVEETVENKGKIEDRDYIIPKSEPSKEEDNGSSPKPQIQIDSKTGDSRTCITVGVLVSCQ